MKYVGMSCVLVACIGMGQYFSVAAIRRIRALEQMLLLLQCDTKRAFLLPALLYGS